MTEPAPAPATEPAVALQFFDPSTGLYGSARRATTILFDGTSSRVLPDGPHVADTGGGWTASLAGELDLSFEPTGPALGQSGGETTICRVSGTVDSRRIACLGTVVKIHEPPHWDELDAVRSLTALFDESNAILATAQRPRGAIGHDAERAESWLLREGELDAPETTRISTVYDGDGRQRSAGLELWLPETDFAIRASGTAIAGSSLQIGQLEAHIGIFRWRIDELEGLGSYELMTRSEKEAA